MGWGEVARLDHGGARRGSATPTGGGARSPLACPSTTRSGCPAPVRSRSRASRSPTTPPARWCRAARGGRPPRRRRVDHRVLARRAVVHAGPPGAPVGRRALRRRAAVGGGLPRGRRRGGAPDAGGRAGQGGARARPAGRRRPPARRPLPARRAWRGATRRAGRTRWTGWSAPRRSCWCAARGGAVWSRVLAGTIWPGPTADGRPRRRAARLGEGPPRAPRWPSQSLVECAAAAVRRADRARRARAAGVAQRHAPGQRRARHAARRRARVAAASWWPPCTRRPRSAAPRARSPCR